ncbi:hypothetical protein F7P69_00745 [Cellulosimicrobium funkei]|nr:hypothetical protein [Cellulosimicrobium funkei]
MSSDRLLIDRHIEGYDHLLSMVVICERCMTRERFGPEGETAWPHWALEHWRQNHDDAESGKPITLAGIRRRAREVGDRPASESQILDETFFASVTEWSVKSPGAVSYENLMETFGINRGQVSSRLAMLRKSGLNIQLFSKTQEAVLAALESGGEALSDRELADLLDMEPVTARRALMTLQRAGHVLEHPNRRWSKNDGRELEPESETVPEPIKGSGKRTDPTPGTRPIDHAALHVLAQGPMTRTEIAEAIGDRNTYLEKRLSLMVRDGLICRPTPGIYALPGTEWKSEHASRVYESRTKAEDDKRILDALADGPMSHSGLKKSTGQSKNALGHRLRKLLKVGSIVKVRHGIYALSENQTNES